MFVYVKKVRLIRRNTMLILKIINRAHVLKNFRSPKYIDVRFINTKEATLSANNETISRKCVKPPRTEERKPLLDNFFLNLFLGKIDKTLFEYPPVLREAEIDIVLNHSAEVEQVLRTNFNVPLTENFLSELKKLELFGLSIPQKYGGAGYNETECTFLHECSSISPTVARFLGYNENYTCKIIDQYGTEEQKQKYLPKLAQGKTFASFAFLENGPIMDFSNIEGFAIDDTVNKKYILTAKKKWVHDADKADLFLVMVKLPQFVNETEDIKLKYSVFLVDKNTPGVTVHKLISTHAGENNLYEVTLKDVSLSYENILGTVKTDGFEVLKSALSYNNVTDAAICLYVMKELIHHSVQFIKENNTLDFLPKVQILVQQNLADMSMHTYALESAVYLVTGRYDLYNYPDLFHETILTKALAIEFLQIVIRKYIEILGRESLKSSTKLQEAIKVLHYYTTFDENIEFLKMIAAGEGLAYSAPKLATLIRQLKKPYETTTGSVNKIFNIDRYRSSSIKKELNSKMELNGALKQFADTLDTNVANFTYAVELFFYNYGAHAMSNQYNIVKFADMGAYIYALIACLSRASCAVCYDFNNCSRDLLFASGFTQIADIKINEIYMQELKHENLLVFYEKLGRMTVGEKEYPAEHPLTRTF